MRIMALISMLVLAGCGARTFHDGQQSVRITSSPSGAWVTAPGGASCKTPCYLALWREKPVEIRAQKLDCKIATKSLRAVYKEGNWMSDPTYELEPNPLKFDLECGNFLGEFQ